MHLQSKFQTGISNKLKITAKNVCSKNVKMSKSAFLNAEIGERVYILTCVTFSIRA
jgi:hypothetical protein